MNYTRPSEYFRFEWGGVRFSGTPDSIPPNKYAVASNVRSTKKKSLKTRPGYVQKWNIPVSAAITDMKAYATLGTDDLPRLLVRSAANKIYLDDGSSEKATLAGSAGYGVSMIPFRPPASSQSWMYIAGLGDYQKLSAPDGSNNVTAQKVGIAEPQAQLEAATNAPAFTTFGATAASWTQGGTAGAPSDSSLISDTVGAAVISDPVVSSRLSVQVSIPYYSAGMLVTFAGTNTYPVEEVWPACATCVITAIRYDSGSSGLCSIVPSIDLSSTLGRGSLISLNSSETVLVLSVTQGNGNCVIRCSTAGTFSASQSIAGVMAIVVHGTVSASQAITVPVVNSVITTGTATLSKSVSAGTFSLYSTDDYIHVTLLLQNIAAVTSVSFIFNTSNVVNYSTSILTYTVQGAALAPLLLAGEVVEVHFPISALSTDPGALNSCNGFRLSVVSTAGQTISIGGLWVGGGSLPDTGDSGSPYYFRAVPRSSLTGAQGNSTPDMRYGVMPRRQSVTVTVPSASYDSQIDTWDYYAYGGSVTQYGYVGSVAAGASVFTFNVSDDTITAAIAAGKVLPTQNYEPWPSIDVAWTVTGATVTAVGSYITVSGPSTWPATILRWLPGTLITLPGFGVCTLRSRPVHVSSTYVFEIEECVGSLSATSISVAEPNVANQILPYVWGPDSYGVFWACGDPLRPGTVYFSQAYNADVAPQTNTIELTSPDKPLLGGCIKGGISIVAGTVKWWAMYPNLVSNGYNQVDMEIGRIPVSPYAIVTDGEQIYFWSRDGISRTGGSGSESITSDDFFNFFPHEGVQGNSSGFSFPVVGLTLYPPDYSKAAQFRLSLFNGYLYADYIDIHSSGIRTMVFDIKNQAWCFDVYGVSIKCHYGIEQQASSLTASPAIYGPLYLADSTGNVYLQTDKHNDDGTGIFCSVQTYEFDGGDLRSQEQWGDLYIDLIPAAAAGVTAQGVYLNASVGPTNLIGAATTRTFAPVSLGGQVTADFMGMAVTWTDDFSSQSVQTELNAWQPSFVTRPEAIIDRVGDWEGSLA